MGRRDLVEGLRARVGAIEGGSPRERPCLPTGVDALDRHLPGGGLARGALHEMTGGGDDLRHGAAPACLAAGLLGRAGGTVLWILSRGDLFPAGIAGALHPDRVVYVETGREDDVLPAAEEGLRHRGLAGVVVEVARLPLLASRRLQLAAEASGVIAVAIRRCGVAHAADLDGTASATRWRLTPVPSAPLGGVPGVGAPRWRAELLRCRGGRPGSWVLEACLETGGLRVVADLADGQAAAPARRGAAA